MLYSNFKKIPWILPIVLAIIVFSTIGYVYAQSPSPDIRITAKNGTTTSSFIFPPGEFWMTWTVGTHTTIGYFEGIDNKTIEFDWTRGWRVGEQPLRGDMNENGILDYADVIELFKKVSSQ